jgi:deoxyribodipyrimidine photolyase-related protein
VGQGTKRKRLLVLFGNQLFPIERIEESEADVIFMAESEKTCRSYRAHRHKLVLILSAMRSKADQLREAGYELVYTRLGDDGGRALGTILSDHLSNEHYEEIVHFETESRGMDTRLEALCCEHGITRRTLQSPMFITGREVFEAYRDSHTRLFMADFYRWQRKRLEVLVDGNGDPEGGQWSFDAENRKKLPKKLVPPALPRPNWTAHTTELVRLVNERFGEHPGDAADFWLPTTGAQADEALESFLEERLCLFGDYEDALSSVHPTVFHSVLSPLMNIGLLTPGTVVDRTLRYAEEQETPLNSVEGFVRQVIGWREFIRGIWTTLPPSHWEQNFWAHERQLTDAWYDGTTGIPPLDDAIVRARTMGYNHHIERLMVVGNLMLLCRVEPRAAYRWFMEMYVDSADWVMAPNVYGMALHSEGGAFTTKPYICGSNYLRKMSDYPRGSWCEVVDGLYWSFIRDHRDFFEKNPRSKMMLGTLGRMDPSRRDGIFRAADEFVARVTR